MAWSYVNSTTPTYNNSASSFATGALSVTTGNLIVVAVYHGPNVARTITDIQDTAGNTYAPHTHSHADDDANSIQFFHAYNVTGHASNVVTVTFDDVTGFTELYQLQFHHTGSTANPFEVEGLPVTSSIGSSIVTQSFTPTAGDLLVSFVVMGGQTTGGFSTSDVTTVQSYDDGTGWGCSAVGYNLSATGGSTVVTWTSTHTGSGAIDGVLAFKEPVGYSAVCYGQTTGIAGTEQATSWTTWELSAGSPSAVTVDGDANWGAVEVVEGLPIVGPVKDTGDATTKTFTIQKDKYATGSGNVTIEIRGSASAFSMHDVTPVWNTYTTPVTQAWQYVQVALTYSA